MTDDINSRQRRLDLARAQMRASHRLLRRLLDHTEKTGLDPLEWTIARHGVLKGSLPVVDLNGDAYTRERALQVYDAWCELSSPFAEEVDEPVDEPYVFRAHQVFEGPSWLKGTKILLTLVWKAGQAAPAV
ncbi:hypothetical protein [Streptomyces coerulescens]|uniref:Uncharacterized protein n=1 Tax=Streptomyces coerulescens TaxID=29304 RepID=A0ABW0CZY1_STRCD